MRVVLVSLAIMGAAGGIAAALLAAALAAPTAGFTQVYGAPVPRSDVRLAMGDSAGHTVTVFSGRVEAGKLLLFTSPTPVPVPPVPPAAAPPQINGYLNSRGEPIGRARDGTTLGAAQVGEEVTVQGFGFGTTPGTVRLGVTAQTVTEWSDTRIRFRVAGADGKPYSAYGPVCTLYLRLPGRRDLAAMAFLVEALP